eukprot:CAMPEP_0113846486 /NCGR_PEP_ID=MMETSP0372-20130328/1333_1 /TAXON_ID=340204 /ORGANISM="Lankesteria abbotti" /LENGTH=137 /DNA_ID=CAMNT_0000815633 /DNA_START=477 /DNA_END=890 /DNA_ORIENTATION=+ /assembly_acc=CAM_ASM_000359
MYSFELWCPLTGDLCAVVFSYCIGHVASDFSAVTLRRDKFSCGSLLTKAVGDIFQKCGLKLWYWGLEVDYMTLQYEGSNIPSDKFYDLWTHYSVQPNSGPQEVQRIISSGQACVASLQEHDYHPRTMEEIFLEDYNV